MTTTTISGHRIRRRGRHKRRSAFAVVARRILTVAGRLTTLALAFSLALTLAIAYGTIDNRWYKVVAVQGGSMSPAIERGDLLFIMRPDHVGVGDIVVFEVDGSVVTHRVVAIGDDGGYVTKGDANSSPDRWGPGEIKIVGEYLFSIPVVGNLFAHGSGAYLTDSDAIPVRVEAEPAPSP